MTAPRRSRQRREASNVGIIISRSNNFTVGRDAADGERGDKPPSPRPTGYRIRTYTGRVLEGMLDVPGDVRGDLLLGIALVRTGNETAIFRARLKGNSVIFDPDDFEAINGNPATVSYLTA